jgi:hypothetical protein
MEEEKYGKIKELERKTKEMEELIKGRGEKGEGEEKETKSERKKEEGKGEDQKSRQMETKDQSI